MLIGLVGNGWWELLIRRIGRGQGNNVAVRIHKKNKGARIIQQDKIQNEIKTNH
jgi:hypothetical protein